MTSFTQIPWSGKKQWQQACLSISHISDQHSKDFEKVCQMAEAIKYKLNTIEPIIDRLCAMTCKDCQDICCNHATIWYDFKDLLYLYLTLHSFPDHQIRKIETENAKSFCCHFSTKGCRLPRPLRPFVCTWYFCATQTRLLKIESPDLKIKIDKTLLQIKVLRNSIEHLFIDLTSG